MARHRLCTEQLTGVWLVPDGNEQSLVRWPRPHPKAGMLAG